MNELLQVWVRNDKGQVYGPLSPPSVELLIDNNVIGGRMQVSTDGVNYVFPGRVPGLRMIFPKASWGDTIVPGDELDAQWSQVVLPASIHGQGGTSGGAPGSAPAGAPPGPPVSSASSGIRSASGGPTAGPGTRPQPGRPMVPGQVGAASRPSNTPMPVVRSSPSVADFMNAGAPAAAVHPSPSVADFMNALEPSAPARPVAAAPPRSSGSGLRPISAPSAHGDLSMPASGSLSERSAQQLYYLAAVCEVTGLLTLKLADRELVAHFKKGSAEFLDSTHLEDSLDTFLFTQKLATRAQLDQGQAQKGQFGGELLGALFGLGLLNPNAVFQHLGQRASQLLQRVLTAEQGTFTFQHVELPAARSMPLGNKWAVYLEALRRVPISDVRRRLHRAIDLPVMKGSGQLQVTDVRLTPQETRALNYFDGVRSLTQLGRDLPAESDTLVRTAWMLLPLELVSFAQVTVPQPPPRPVVAATPAPVSAQPSKVPGPPVMRPASSPTPGPVPGNPVQMPKPAAPYPGGPTPVIAPPPLMKPAVVVAAPVNFEAETKQLQVVHDQMKKQNFFEVLGLKRDADAGAVKLAYLKAARSYHPDTVTPGSPAALAKLKADVFALISEANRTLSDPGLRKEYTAELDAGGTGSKVDIERIMRAEEVFQKGRILVQARKYPDAFKLFDEAVSCNGDEAEFYAWRGYARFLMASDRKAASADAVKDMNLCVSKNPTVAAAYYFLGFVAKFNGDAKTAMNHFKKCVSLDPKHIDAQREVRSIKK